MNATPRPHFEEIDWFDYVLGEADAEKNGELSAHLGGCERCRRSVGEYERLARAIPAAAHLAVDPSSGSDRDADVAAAAIRAAGSRRRGPANGALLRNAFADGGRSEIAWNAALVGEARALSRELLRSDRGLAARIARAALAGLESGCPADAADDAAALRATLAYVFGMEDRFDDAMTLFERARVEIEQRSAVPEVELAFWHYARCSAFHNVGRPEDALAEIRAAVSLYERLEDDNRLGRCRQTEALLLSELGRPEDAIAIERRLLDDPRAAEDAPLHATLLLNYGADLLAAGRLEEARGIYARALDRLRQTGQENLQFRVRAGLARIAEKEGRLHDALAIDVALRPDYRALSIPWEDVINELDIADLMLRVGRTSEAAAVCRDLVERSEEADLPREAARALAYLGEAEREVDRARVGRVRAFIRRVEQGENPAWSAA